MRKSKHSLFYKWDLLAVNSIHEVVSDTPFSIFLSNVCAQEHSLTKKTAFPLAARSPIALISLSGPGGQEFCQIIYIFSPITTSTSTKGRDPSRAPFMKAYLPGANICSAASTTTHGCAKFISRAPASPCLIWCSLYHCKPSPNTSRALYPSQYMERVGRRAGLVSLPLTGRSLSTVQTHLRPSSQKRPRWMIQNVNWREAMDMCHMQSVSLKMRIMAVLETHCGRYTVTLGTIKPIDHRTDLHPDTKPISLQPYRAGPKSLEVLEEHIQT